MHNFRFLILILAIFVGGCAGSRGVMTFDNLRHPTSMSAYIYGPNDEVLAKEDLMVMGNVHIEKAYWGFMFSLVNVSDDKKIVDAINQQVDEKGGDGVINLSVTAEGCAISGFTILQLLPIWPGCTNVVVTGDIVKAREMKADIPKPPALPVVPPAARSMDSIPKKEPSKPEVYQISVTPESVPAGTYPEIKVYISNPSNPSSGNSTKAVYDIKNVITFPGGKNRTAWWDDVGFEANQKKAYSKSNNYDVNQPGTYTVEFSVYDGERKNLLSSRSKTFTVNNLSEKEAKSK